MTFVSTLRIPQELDDLIVELIALDDATLRQLEKAVDDVTASPGHSDFVSEILTRMDPDNQRVEPIVHLLMTLNLAKALQNVSASDLTEHLAAVLGAKTPPTANLSEAERDSLTHRLQSLLSFNRMLGRTTQADDHPISRVIGKYESDMWDEVLGEMERDRRDEEFAAEGG